MLNEVSQRKTNTLISLICGIKRNRLTDTENKLVVTSGEREGGWGGARQG